MVRDHHMWGGRQEPPPADDAPAWILGALPDDWFTQRPDISIDRDEIVIVGRLPEPTLAAEPADDAATEKVAAEKVAAESGRIASFREGTRERRIKIAQQLERRYRRKVAWGAACGDSTELFTTFAAPAMTRLRQPERQVLDTLVDAGVARSRSEALAWCVRLVGEHAEQWLGQLREAMGAVDELRRQGPAL
ncbi:MAG: hypothetical protein V7603_5240 [Micromonosporaceae bacterium]